MTGSEKPPVWRMVHEAVEALGGKTTNGAVRDWILERYAGTNKNTIQCQIIVCTVNHDSRVHYPENQKPRKADTRYDFLYRSGRGQLELYDPARDGQWDIYKRKYGRLGVRRTDSAVVLGEGGGNSAMALRVPLGSEQILAAGRIHARLGQWQASDRALAALGQRFPEFDMDACMLKVVTINALYGTNVFAVVRMAKHVAGIMARAHRLDGTELVERIAALPRAPGQEKARRHISFAAKFAHFFIDADAFPIFDSYAEKMVEYHLGALRVRDTRHPYRAFVANFGQLKRLSGWGGSNRELDHYLWIAGQYQAWRRNPDAQINAELSRLFAVPSADVASDLRVLSHSASSMTA